MPALGKAVPDSGEESSPPFVNKKGTVCNSHSIYGEFIQKHVPKLHWESRLQKRCRECANRYDLPRPQFSYVIPLKYSSSLTTASYTGCYLNEMRGERSLEFRARTVSVMPHYECHREKIFQKDA